MTLDLILVSMTLIAVSIPLITNIAGMMTIIIVITTSIVITIVITIGSVTVTVVTTTTTATVAAAVIEITHQLNTLSLGTSY